jgi:putative ABC transport system permease protein
MSLGVSDAFVRPVRGGLTVIAILIGVATLTFAYGFHSTLNTLDKEPATHSNDFVGGAYQVEVSPIAGIDDARIMRLLRAQPETANVVAFSSRFLSVAGLSDTVQAIFVRGNATRLGYRAIAGRWFTRPGEAVAAAAFIKMAHLHVGDRFTATLDGRRIRLRLVGEDFDLTNQGQVIRTDWSTITAAQPGVMPDHYAVQLRQGTDPAAFGHRLVHAEPSAIEVDLNNSGLGDSLLPILNGVVAVLAAVLCLIAVAGVFNTMLLTTRERVRDTAVLKALGMEPRQTVAMVAATSCVLGITGGVLGLPVGIVLHGGVLGLVGALAGNTMPIDTARAFAPAMLPVLALAGVLVALAGALLPARWAARVAATTVLRTE